MDPPARHGGPDNDFDGNPFDVHRRPTLHFHHLMRDYLLEVARGRMTETAAVAAVARRIQAGLRCTRVNFWSVSGPRGRRAMERVAGFDGLRGEALTAPLRFDETDGVFFDTLQEHGCYVCPDTSADPKFADVYASYLQPTDSRTLLFAAFHQDPSAWGLISCVHNEHRAWTAAEIAALRKCAAELSRQRARRGRAA